MNTLFFFASVKQNSRFKLILNHLGIISGTYFRPIQGSLTLIGAAGIQNHISAFFVILNDFPHILLNE